MKDKILFLLADSTQSVRLIKIATFCKNLNLALSFSGWSRNTSKIQNDPLYSDITTILHGGGNATKILPFMYILYMIKQFFYLLMRKGIKDEIVYAINFESAFSVWLASKIRHFKYIYDIWDELAISHNFSPTVKGFIRHVDRKIRKDSVFYIHVDENRISEIDGDNYIIIYNSPVDLYKKETQVEYENSFAVTGWLNKTRGLQSIYDCARNHPEIKFIIAGRFNQKDFESKFLSLTNIEYHDFMPQSKLFELIKSCRGIFSLYDPSIEINRLAASNKLYDAMMLSVPVIVNKGIMAESFVQEKRIGYVVNYTYDESWTELCRFDTEISTTYGSNGRQIYKKKFEFNKMLDCVLLPKLKEL